MYENSRKWIDKNSLINIVDSPSPFIEKMEQQGFLTGYVNEGEETYSFAIDTLTDYLLAREIWSQFNKDNLLSYILQYYRKICKKIIYKSFYTFI